MRQENGKAVIGSLPGRARQNAKYEMATGIAAGGGASGYDYECQQHLSQIIQESVNILEAIVGGHPRI
jgi:hypothetical protein